MLSDFHERGCASLEVDRVFNESTVTGVYATSPLKLLTPRSRGDCVCTYAANFGGGLVAGDKTRLDVRVGERAKCFLGTQASTKIYRNPHRLPCTHTTRANVESGALLVFAPTPIQPFADSSYTQNQEFRLGPGAGLVLLDWFTSGRSACGERWKFSHLFTRNQIWQSFAPKSTTDSTGQLSGNLSKPSVPDKCIFWDACSLNASETRLDAVHRTGRFNCFATIVLVGAPVQAIADRVLEDATRTPVKRRGSLLLSASEIESGAVLRIAGEEVAEVDRHLRKHLASLADLLGEDPWSRRW
jgi:urease accessory protein UreH